ncbi:MAG: type I-C CRISPR-associated protein Cas5c [Desulfotignum sp.]|nr:type I-C CRISPR-associated protein Cas5c [Desulfotignum sp.]MCF8086789.1 type I-C CRISPR-associated protein Cas5c [Desulfotignum sp.]MCF8136739.1 type I-C CRISPR-associated protein Cas5c [Desulfotignum sp.]
MNEKRFCLEVWGDYACFTRPEMKVERVSYDVITPSASRAIFEAIFWKPAVKWHIREIEVLAPIKTISVRRNEVGSTAGTGKKSEIFIEDNRLQRAGLFLRDVRYRIHAWMEYIPVKDRNGNFKTVSEILWDKEEVADIQETIEACKAKNDESPGKYLAMFERRAKKGQCFNQPYLGCREFSANFEFVKDTSSYVNGYSPIKESRDLGFMLYDLDFSDPKDLRPAFYRAEMKNGKIVVPEWNSEEVRK